MRDVDVLRRLGDELTPPPLDLLRGHARRRRRRHRTLAAAAVGVALVVGIVGVRFQGQAEPDPADRVDDVRPMSYADGTVVHLGDQALSVPGIVAELDPTDAGAVVRTEDGRIWSVDGATVRMVGSLGEPGTAYRRAQPVGASSWVVTESRGPLAAWYEFPRPGKPVLVVYDTTGDAVVHRGPVTAAPEASHPVAVDGRAAFWTSATSSGVVGRLDLETAQQDVVPASEQASSLAGAGPARTLLEGGTVSNGIGSRLRLAGDRLEPVAGDSRVWDGSSYEPWGYTAPQGITSGQTGVLAQWIDDDAVVVELAHDMRIDLFRCSTSRETCELEKTVPPYAVVPGP